MGRSFLAVVPCCVAVLAAQEVASAKLDLPAIAAQLRGDDVLPDVLAEFPVDRVTALRSLDALLTEAERDLLLVWLPRHPAALAAAVGALARTAEAVTVAARVREIRACMIVFIRGRDARVKETMVGREAAMTSAAAPALARAKVLAGRFLRDCSDTPQVADVLSVLEEQIEATQRDAARALVRTWRSASANEHLRSARALLRSGDLTGAEQALDTVLAVEPPPLLELQEALVDGRHSLRADIDTARAWQVRAAGSDESSRLARLRFLAITDPGRAVELSRAMVGEGVAHALPSTILTADALFTGRREEALAHLDRAVTLPGADVWTATMLWMLRAVPERTPPVDGPERQEAIRGVLATCDALVAKDDSGQAAMFRALRSLDWPEAKVGRGPMPLTGAADFAAAFPASPDAYRMLLAAVLAERDATKARAALEQPLPVQLTDAPGLARARAYVAVHQELVERRAGSTDRTAPFLQALAAAHGERDVHFLKGVLAWSRGERAVAREHFLEGARLPFERGGLMVSSALDVADRLLGKAVDQREAAWLVAIAAEAHYPQAVVPSYIAELLGEPSTGLMRRAATLAESPDLLKSWTFALHAALAVAHDKAGDRSAAGAAAKRALAARADFLPRWDLVAQGILVNREMRWEFGASMGGPELTVTLNCEFFVIPELPSREHLERLARDD